MHVMHLGINGMTCTAVLYFIMYKVSNSCLKIKGKSHPTNFITLAHMGLPIFFSFLIMSVNVLQAKMEMKLTMYMYISVFFCCPPEIFTTLLINYMQRQNNFEYILCHRHHGDYRMLISNLLTRDILICLLLPKHY